MPPQISSSVSDFIVNLRLLDFDYQEDWPGITAALFLAKDARANQRQRIHCVEWALYRLFELWSPKETKNKLQPFYPPYDALRSIDLRAALFRCLSELKTNGTLGKEIILRKTMFDECRGEKFEELLATFSTIVLQKTLKKRPYTNTSIAGRLATCQNVSEREQRSFLPLAIAHRGALRALLHRKELLKERFAKLQDTLEVKEQQLLERVEYLAQAEKDCPLGAVPDRAVQMIHDQFDRSWQGDRGWINGIVEGDRRDFGDLLLDNAFLTIWGHVEDGTIDSIKPSGHPSLLQDLNQRIHNQQTRLQHWQKTQQELIESRPRSPVKAKDKTTPCRSREVQSPLKFGHIDPYGAGSIPQDQTISPEMKTRYRKLLERSRSNTQTASIQAPKTPANASEGLNTCDSVKISRVRPAFDPPVMDSALPAPLERVRRPNATYLEEPPGAAGLETGEPIEPPSPSIDTLGFMQLDPKCDGKPPSTSVCNDKVVQGCRLEPRLKRGKHEQTCHDLGRSDLHSTPASGACPVNEEDVLAQKIISSAMNTEPSPIKSKSSLVERTRQSMAFTRLNSLLPDSLDGSTLIQSTDKDNLDRTGCVTLDRSSSLIERTRRSISLLPSSATTSQGPRKSIHNRRQSKQYPRNQFETPKRQLEDVKEMTPPEILFSPEADYASVFKSRPKVATSPNLSPVLAQQTLWDGGVYEDRDPLMLEN